MLIPRIHRLPIGPWVVVLLALGFTMPRGAGAQDDRAPIVSSLRFEGVEAVTRSDLLEHVLTKPRGPWPWSEAVPPFEEDTLREDLDRVTELYSRHGYFGASARYELAWNDDRSAVAVEIQVVEGEPVLLTVLELDLGAADPGDLGLGGAWREGLALRLGERFSVPAYASSKETLLSRAKERGYLAARLEGGADVEVARLAARVRWKLFPGPRVRLLDLRVSGLASVEEALLTRELSLDPGDLLTPAKLRTAQRAVYETGHFRTVAIKAVPPARDEAAEQRWPVEIRVEERPPRSLRAGLGYGTEDQVRARLGWEHRNWQGGGRRLDFEGKVSSLVFGFSGGLLQPRFLDDVTDLSIRTHALREEEPAYDADRIALGASLERPFGERLTGRLGLGVEWARLLDSPDEPPSRLDTRESVRLAYLDLGLDWSDLDDQLDPRRGWRLQLGAQPTTHLLGSQFAFLRATAEARGYLPLGPTVLALKLRLGTAQPLEGDARRDVPIFERFFLGGSTTVRGFDYQDIGPKDADGDPVGGLSLLEASAELRFPLRGDLGGVVFVDAGRLDRKPFSFAGALSVSAGVGLRYTTPVGPLRLDVGHPLSRSGGSSGPRVHFSIGQAF